MGRYTKLNVRSGLMVNHRFLPQRLIGRTAELQTLRQILLEDGDLWLVGAPGIGRRTLLHTAATQIGARVLEIDCLRTTSTSRFLRLLADSIVEAFAHPAEFALLEQWSSTRPFVLERSETQRPRLVWYSSSSQEWSLLQSLLELPQSIAERLDCRVVIVFLNFPHIRSWDRTGKWEGYLRQEIQQQSRVSYALVSTVPDVAWVQENHLPVIALELLDNDTMKSWLIPAMAEEGLAFDAESQAIDRFLGIVQGHPGAAITLARRIWLDLHSFPQPDLIEPVVKALPPSDRFPTQIEAHHVYRSTLALVEDLSITFESLILLLPPSQVRVLESLALDPTDKPQSREYIQKHQLTRGGGLQGALTSLEQKGLLYGPQQNYQIALPFLGFWLKQRLQ